MIWLLALCARSIGQRLHQIGILKHIAATIGVPDQPLLDDTLAIELANTDQSLPHLVGEPCDNNTIYHRFAQDDLLLYQRAHELILFWDAKLFHSGSNSSTPWHLKKGISHVLVGINRSAHWSRPEAPRESVLSCGQQYQPAGIRCSTISAHQLQPAGIVSSLKLYSG